jgi:hypothetical protein
MLSPTQARRKLATKAGKNIGTPYYSVGLEVPARRGSTFSMRYTQVSSARAGRKFLRNRLLRKRVGMVGSLYLFSEDGRHNVELMAGVREQGNKVYTVDGNTRVGQVRRHYRARRNGSK